MSVSAQPRRRARFTRTAMLLGASAAALGWVTTAGADLTPEEIASARAHAYQLNAQGRCAEAMPIWEELGSVLSRASDYLDAANCAIEAGDSARAVADLWEVVRRRDQLDTEQQLFALRSLGYQAEAQGDWDRSLIGWDYAAQLSDAPSDKLQAARAARLSGRTGDAQSRLWQVRPGEFEGVALAQYYDEQAQVLRESQPEMAAQYMARAIAIDDQSWRRFDHGLMLQAAGEPRAAVGEFRTVLAQDPSNTDVRLSLAYALRSIGENAEAAQHFGEVIAVQPDNLGIREDQAYAFKDAGQQAEAGAAFIGVIDRLQAEGGEAAHAERLYRLRREVTALESRTSGFAYASYRNEGVSLSGGLQDSITQSSLGAEFSWRPEGLYENGTGITLFGRGYVSMEPGSFSLDDDSAQLGVGARWKPFQSVDFSLSGERLVALGDNARDDWLLRASYGWTNGYDWKPEASSWNYTSVYADLAYIPGDNEYFGAYAQVRQGRRFRTAEGWTVTPYVTAVAQYSDDIYGSQDRFEAGPGVSVSHWFGEDDHHAYRRRVDFDVEYLFDVEGSGDDALMARVVFSF
ncbi:NfrA family protein [Maricaulis sp.]|uniref:NfrA family protein n=1 Tax=Maricaulis sp. TaxID=1486257 RepID=UPI003A919BA3